MDARQPVGPQDVTISEQMAFLAGVLPGPPVRILDAGCGSGELLRRLLARGFDAVGVDADPDAVAAARAAGVSAVEADFTDYQDDPFDVVVFSRSLHHMRSLPKAVDRAAALLQPGGLLVADEFARDWVDGVTAAWFYDTLTLLQTAGVLAPGEGEGVPPAGDPLTRWRAQHGQDPPMHGGDAMLHAVQARFDVLTVTEAPYLYCYLGGWLEESRRGHRLARELLEIERRRVEQGSLAPTGLRLVARRPG